MVVFAERVVQFGTNYEKKNVKKKCYVGLVGGWPLIVFELIFVNLQKILMDYTLNNHLTDRKCLVFSV